MQEKFFYVYILTNKRHTVLYTGVTNDLNRRLTEHQSKSHPVSFTAKYKTNKLIYYDAVENIWSAIEMEKRIKGWTRAKKVQLINERNPHWEDLFDEVAQG